MGLDEKKIMKQVLEEIDFINRYNALLEKYSLKVIPMDQTCNSYGVEYVKELLEDIGYEVKFNKRERFFHTKKENIDGFVFNTHFDLKYGAVEMIWNVIYREKCIVGDLINWFSKQYLEHTHLKRIVYSDPDQLYEIFEALYKMYEDFKVAFLKAVKENG